MYESFFFLVFKLCYPYDFYEIMYIVLIDN